MKYQVVHNHRFHFSVQKMCELLQIARSGYYKWRRHPESRRSQEDKVLLREITSEYDRSRKLYGVRKIVAALHTRGISCGHNRIANLMRIHDLHSLRKRKWRICTTDSNHRMPVAENILARNFAPGLPNKVWQRTLPM